MKKSDIFQSILIRPNKRSHFDLGHSVKTTFNIGELIPTCIVETLPGEVFKLKSNALVKMEPMIAPVFHRIKLKQEWFFSPNRIVYAGWQEWIMGNNEVLAPTINMLNNTARGSLGNQLSYPTASGVNHNLLKMNVLPLAHYVKIWDDWYRNDYVQDTERFIPLVAGLNTPYNAILQGKPYLRNFMKDRLTSALPFAQAGDAVAIPLLEADVTLKGPGNTPNAPSFKDQQTHVNTTNDSVVAAGAAELHVGATKAVMDPNGTLQVVPTNTPIENLRRAKALQRFYEKKARGGGRYTDFLKVQHGTSNGDLRLQRSYYIGGSTHNMRLTEVLATAQDNTSGSEIPVGYRAGHGVGVGTGNTHHYNCKDYGFIFCLTSVTPFTSYTQFLPKMYYRNSYLDYFLNDFANIGEQPILNQEVYIGSETIEKLGETFGYTPKDSEYKYYNDRVHGEFETGGTYSNWTLLRKFSSAPSLTSEFVEVDPAKFNDIFAVTDETIPKLQGYFLNEVHAWRKIPKWSTPAG